MEKSHHFDCKVNFSGGTKLFVDVKEIISAEARTGKQASTGKRFLLGETMECTVESVLLPPVRDKINENKNKFWLYFQRSFLEEFCQGRFGRKSWSLYRGGPAHVEFFYCIVIVHVTGVEFFLRICLKMV